MATIAEGREVLKQELEAGRTGVWGPWLPESVEAGCRAAEHRWRDRFWTPLQTMWTFLWQVLEVGSSCRDAVAMALAEQAAAGRPWMPSAAPTAYCQARRRLPLAVVRDGLRRVGRRLREQVGATITWCGRQVWLVDGTTCSMPDTPDLQAAFSQPDGQAPGCGFPVAKVVALLCWASGAVLEVAIGPLWMSELQLWRDLWPVLSPGEIVVGDRFYCTFYDVVGVMRRGCDAVFRLHQKRPEDLRRGRRLGRNDRLVTWQRPTWNARPRGMNRRQWKALPPTLSIRLIRFTVAIPGFRCKTITVATTLLDPQAYPAERIAALYRDRWLIELRFRDIKTTMGMEVLRGKSADVVRKEIVMHLLAYNLIRGLMWQAAELHGRPLHRLSFAGTVGRLRALSPYIHVYGGSDRAVALHELLLRWVAADILPYRPNRVEPRAVKRRPKQYALLNRPRHPMRKALLR
ncbi:MAG TPA: IS4 family transposase [Phycisphaerae bacterium]|nr:IS4 family transposase [Phycisphaerae bacterium]